MQAHDDNLNTRRNSAVRNFGSAEAAHDAYATGRQRGIKKSGKWIVQHAGSFGEFVEKYARIIEAVASAGGPYGTIAYQTLSILLRVSPKFHFPNLTVGSATSDLIQVCVNKVRNDNKIIDLLEQLRKYLPRLENWTNIYPGPVMRTLVASAYTQVTEFSRKSAEYLSKFGSRCNILVLSTIRRQLSCLISVQKQGGCF